MPEEFHCDLDAHIAESMKDPEYAAAVARIEAEREFMVEQPCVEGCCVEIIDTRTGENTGGWGPVGCPCQGEPGWFRRVWSRVRGVWSW